MFKRLSLYLSLALISLLGACALAASPGAEGEVQILFGADRSSRALADPPMAELPVLSSVRITISGPGMESVEFTVDGAQGSFTALVPGGDERRVELYATVDWAATQVLFPAAQLPTLVKAYGAVTSVDVVPGQRVSAVLKLGVVETKILLPDAYSSGVLKIADGLDATPVNAGVALNRYGNTDYEFDRLGRLIIADGSVSLARNETDGNPMSLTLSGSDLAYDRGIDRLYSLYDSDGMYLYGYDFTSETPASFEINLPTDYSFYLTGSVAVDDAGFVYLPAFYAPGDDNGLLKIAVGAPSGGFASSTALAFVPLSSFGADYFVELRELAVKDGKLYALIGENTYAAPPHHGKLIEIDTANLAVLRELGWSDADYPASPSTQFYGPERFIALAPRKLIIADEGYDGVADVDRVVEVDLDEWSISDIGQEGAVSFFNSYFC